MAIDHCRLRLFYGVMSFILGALFVSALSIPQKVLLGASLTALKGYIFQVLIGGVSGIVIGIFFARRNLYVMNLRKLLLISNEINATTDLKTLYRNIVNASKELLDLDFSTLMILSDDKKQLVIQDTVGFPESMIGTFSLTEGQGLSTYVVKNRRPAIVADFKTEIRFEVPKVVFEKSITSAICVPMMIEDELFGILIGHTLRKRLFSKDAISLYHNFANQAAVAVRHSINLEAVNESEKKYRSLFEDSRDAIYMTSVYGKFLDVNPATLALFGYTREEMIGMEVLNIYYDPSDRQKFQFAIAVNGYVKDYEVRFLKKDGTVMDCLLTSTIQYDREDNITGYKGVIRDDTERRRHEKEIILLQSITLAVSETYDIRSALEVTIRKVCEATGWVLGEAWILCPDRRHLEWSAVWCKDYDNEKLVRFIEESKGFTFVSGEGLPGRVWSSKKSLWLSDVTINGNFPRAPYALEAGLKAAIGVPIMAGDNVVATLNFFVCEVRDEDERLLGLISSVADQLGSVLERKMAEDALRGSEERFRQMAENISEVFWVASPDMERFEYISPAYEDIYGSPCNELYEHPDKWLETVYPPDSDSAVKAFSPLRLNSGSIDVEYRITRPDGSIRWIRSRGFPVRDRTGSIHRIVGISGDITEQKKLEEQLRHAVKMEAVGQLAGGIAHDFNNILTAIIGYASVMGMRLTAGDPLKVYIDRILSASERAAALTQGLLAFSRKQIISPKQIDLNNIIGIVERLLQRVIGEDIEFKSVLTDKELVIVADVGQIEQVLMNLATNARDAMPDGGQLTVKTGLIELDSEFIKTHGYGGQGMYALLSVSDTGAGMDEATREKIFEPFFTTKEVGKGTGLGMSIVYGVVKQHNGFINVYSEPGKGTTFRIYLPLYIPGADPDVVGSAMSRVAEEECEKPVQGGTETVLMGEDDPNVRSVVKEVLERYGYKVIEAVDGDDAIAKFFEHEHMEDVRLLLLDVVMPKKNGKEVYEEIKKFVPCIKVLFTSGYTANVIHKKGVLDEGLIFISKPVAPNELLRKVREVLDS
ncbi:MAG: PAS domain S-box protein [Nitrospirota bacterium]